MSRRLLVLGACLVAGRAAAQIDVTGRATIFPGPYEAEVVRVVDGDTREVNVALWPGLRAEYAVRVRGIDAPELHRPACREEAELALEARDQAERLCPSGTIVQLREVSRDAFGGRVVAEVRCWRSDRWLSFAREMTERNLAAPWEPHQSAFAWCPPPAAAGTE